jgi:DnaK suppressor protein
VPSATLKKKSTPTKAAPTTGKASTTKTPVKAGAKVASKAVPAKVAAPKAKAVPAPKSTAKTVTKVGAKVSAVAKPTKAAAKVATSKPAGKVTPQVKAKLGVKTATKPTAKPAAKPAAKAAKPVTAKAPAKVAVKPAPKAAAKSTAKAAPQVTAKTGAKPAAKAVGKAAAKAASKPVSTPSTSTKAATKTASKSAAAAADASSPNRRKSTRRGPMAPSMDATTVVASSAAKASFLLSPEPEMITPTHTPAQKDPKRANAWKNKPLNELVDEDLLAMPDDEYMNDVQTAYFRATLVKLKTDILANAGQTTEHLREDTVVVPDPADRATIEEEHALELRTRDRERKLLKKIEQSIARIDAGDYGFCDETGEPIGVGRLLARPTASLSLEAQQRRELKQKMFGD